MQPDAAIRQLIRTALGMPENSVRAANQTGMPSGTRNEPYATVLVTSYAPIGWDQTRVTNEPAPSLNIAESADGVRHVTASVQFFRQDALVRGRRLKAALSLSGSVALMQELGLALRSVGPTQDLTDVVDTLFEERCRVQLEFQVSSVETASVPTYGQFPFSISVNADSAQFEVNAP